MKMDLVKAGLLVGITWMLTFFALNDTHGKARRELQERYSDARREDSREISRLNSLIRQERRDWRAHIDKLEADHRKQLSAQETRHLIEQADLFALMKKENLIAEPIEPRKQE
jgi:hypothetical protein